jgi:hypothetical protein
MTPDSIVFLVDVDNTLLDNDRVQDDIKRHLAREFGIASRDRYWAIPRATFRGARLPRLFRCPAALPSRAPARYSSAVDERNRSSTSSDGDVVFQPRKVERSGIFEAVDGHVLIYIHKEETLDDVEQRYPAERYVLVDDKPRILHSVKKIWGHRVTTIFPRQGQYAHDPKAIAEYLRADLTVERIGDLMDYDLPALLAGNNQSQSLRR